MEFSRPPYIRKFARRTHRTPHIAVLMTKMYCNHLVRIHSCIIREETGRICRNPCVGFLLLSLSSVGGHTEHILLPAAKIEQHVCDGSAQRSPLEARHPRFLLRAGHIGMLCIAHIKIPDAPERKQVFSINCSVCTNRQDIGSHSYQLTVDWKCSGSQFPRHHLRANLAGRPFYG